MQVHLHCRHKWKYAVILHPLHTFNIWLTYAMASNLFRVFLDKNSSRHIHSRETHGQCGCVVSRLKRQITPTFPHCSIFLCCAAHTSEPMRIVYNGFWHQCRCLIFKRWNLKYVLIVNTCLSSGIFENILIDNSKQFSCLIYYFKSTKMQDILGNH